MPQIESTLAALAGHLRRASHMLIFTGAGVSTGSGIPDFRGPQGVWKTRQPVYYDEFMASEVDLPRQSLDRRQFLWTAALAGLAGVSCRVTSSTTKESRIEAGPADQFFFTSNGRTALMNADGTGLRYLEFHRPGQVTWQPGPFFSDGRRVVFLSMEQRRDGPGRPFDAYYTQTPTRLWIYDLQKDSLTEIATRDRLAVFYTPSLVLGEDRILVQVVRNRVGQIFSMNLDGTDAMEFTRPDEGLPYGLSLSPDGRRVAFHLAGPRGYEIWTSNLDGGDRIRVAGHPDHLFFGTSWSPDGRWILFQDCHHRDDPGHDWSDICIGHPGGDGYRQLTLGQAHWFGAAYGNPQNRAGGSNMPAWTRDGSILFSRKLPDSKVPWEYQRDLPDEDHFNRVFQPDQARGGTEICRIHPEIGEVARLTAAGPGTWDFRASESPSGGHIVFCRAPVGEPPSIWMMRADGGAPRPLTQGWEGKGADHPRWIP